MTLGLGDYAVTLSERNGRILWQSRVSTLSSVAWGREKNEVSKATISTVMPAEITHLLEPWIHLLTIERDGDLVWEGIVVRIESRKNFVTIDASDAAFMFSRRRVPHGRVWRQHDASQVMRTHVEDALGYKDPTNIVENIVERPSRLWVTAAYDAAECMIDEVVDDLVGQGLSWCVSAGRLLIGPVASEYTTAQLSDAHLDAEMTVVKDGSEVVTDALVVGKGVWGQYVDSLSPLGLIQAIESADGAVRSAECSMQAKRLVDDASVTPRRLTIPSGSRLLPDAPVSLSELIPGVQVPVSSRQTGVLMSSLMQLTSLSVTADSGGENIQITLEETTVTGDVPSLPDPADLDWRSPYEREIAGQQGTNTGSATQHSEDDVGIPPA